MTTVYDWDSGSSPPQPDCDAAGEADEGALIQCQPTQQAAISPAIAQCSGDATLADASSAASACGQQHHLHHTCPVQLAPPTGDCKMKPLSDAAGNAPDRHYLQATSLSRLVLVAPSNALPLRNVPSFSQAVGGDQNDRGLWPQGEGGNSAAATTTVSQHISGNSRHDATSPSYQQLPAGDIVDKAAIPANVSMNAWKTQPNVQSSWLQPGSCFSSTAQQAPLPQLQPGSRRGCKHLDTAAEEVAAKQISMASTQSIGAAAPDADSLSHVTADAGTSIESANGFVHSAPANSFTTDAGTSIESAKSFVRNTPAKPVTAGSIQLDAAALQRVADQVGVAPEVVIRANQVLDCLMQPPFSGPSHPGQIPSHDMGGIINAAMKAMRKHAPIRRRKPATQTASWSEQAPGASCSNLQSDACSLGVNSGSHEATNERNLSGSRDTSVLKAASHFPQETASAASRKTSAVCQQLQEPATSACDLPALSTMLRRQVPGLESADKSHSIISGPQLESLPGPQGSTQVKAGSLDSPCDNHGTAISPHDPKSDQKKSQDAGSMRELVADDESSSQVEREASPAPACSSELPPAASLSESKHAEDVVKAADAKKQIFSPQEKAASTVAQVGLQEQHPEDYGSRETAETTAEDAVADDSSREVCRCLAFCLQFT